MSASKPNEHNARPDAAAAAVIPTDRVRAVATWSASRAAVGLHTLFRRARTPAFGILMYQLFMGGLPFDADTLSGLREQICSSSTTPPWRAPDERVSARLMAVMDVCLSKRQSARFASIRELRTLLEQVAAGG